MKYSKVFLSLLIFLAFSISSSFADHGKIRKIERSNKEWKQLLTPEQYHILRENGTEYAYNSILNDEYGAGTYVCAACDLPLFKSETKYDSYTGWPSFWEPIQGHVETRQEGLRQYFGIIWSSMEYHCVRCGSHQGHIFKDGPPEHGGVRYCNNGLALKFMARVDRG